MTDRTDLSRLAPIRTSVRDSVARAWDRAVASGALPKWSADAARPHVDVERPADPVHGDFASNLAMKLARPYRMAPLAIATALAAELQAEADDTASATPIATVEVAPPGFLNLRLRETALEAVVAAILADPAGWGRVTPDAPRSVNVEFVSANPTGPLHVGNARGAFIGDLLSRVLEAGGQRVTREYYFNDFRRPDPEPRSVRCRAPARRAGPGRRLPRRVRRGPRHGDPRRRLGRGHGERRRHGRPRRQVGGRPGPRGDRGQPGRPRRPVRCLDERGPPPRRRLGGQGGRSTARARPRLRGGRRGLVPVDRVR